MTSSDLASLLVLAITAALSPFSLVAFSLVLATDRGTRNGFAFIMGWITTVTLIGVVAELIGSSVTVSSSNTPGAWTLALELAMGVALILAWIRRRFRPRHEPEVVAAKPEPAWQRRIATMGYPGAFVVGGLTQTWPVMIAAATQLVRLDLGTATTILWMFAFAVVTTAGIVVLEILAIRSPGSAAGRLNRIRSYVDDHRDSVLNWVYLVGGLWLAIKAAIGLISR